MLELSPKDGTRARARLIRVLHYEHELAIGRSFGVEKTGDASKLVFSFRSQDVGGHPHGI